MFNPELLVMFIALAVGGFAAWRIASSRSAVKQDESFAATLIGTLGGRTVAARDEQGPRAAEGLEKRFRSAGLEAPAIAVLGLLLLLGIAAALIVAAIFPGVRWAYPLFGIAAIWIAYSLIADVARFRSWRFENRLADAIDLMVGALSAGETTVDAMASAASGSQKPVSTELNATVERLRGSVPIERSLAPMNNKYDSEGVRLFTQLLVAKWEIGGPLAPALQAVNRTLRQSLRLRGQLQTQITSAQNAAVLVAILPYVAVAIFLWKSPEALMKVWSMPSGQAMFLGAILLQVAGFLWLRSMLRTEI